jgi:hypothetical protein
MRAEMVQGFRMVLSFPLCTLYSDSLEDDISEDNTCIRCKVLNVIYTHSHVQ